MESVDDVLRLLRVAQERRRVSETRMNKASSRSHCLFSIHVTTVEEQAGLKDGLVREDTITRTGRLHLCDLAGSENAKTAADEKNPALERERKNINQSLLTLGRVIISLNDSSAKASSSSSSSSSSSMRTPYRDSKLTRILRDALGGKSKTCIIATVSPSILAVDET